jgi:hypothetical protein
MSVYIEQGWCKLAQETRKAMRIDFQHLHTNISPLAGWPRDWGSRDHFLLHSVQNGSVGRLNCCWPSPAQSFLASGLVEIYEQDFCSPLDMYVFRNGASSLMRGGVGLSTDRLNFEFDAGPRQHSDSWFRLRRDTWPYFTLSRTTLGSI